ncbi:MAG: YdbL family protein [Pseudohongiella sp.]|uniref:YdbL family protein n=1 Tax=Pseudohongiella sp. TaxID=1979412 RepID=UPI00349FDFE8
MRENTCIKFITRTTALALFLLASLAFAQSLDDAKASGQIGEKNDGYIGLVQPDAPQALVDLVAEVNRQRRERYQQIARDNNISVNEVAQLAYARAVEATRSGHLVEDANGRWVRKP